MNAESSAPSPSFPLVQALLEADPLLSLVDLLTLGEAAGRLVHAVNNHLNGISMQAALLQTKVDEASRERLAIIRNLAGQAANQLRAVQEVRPWHVGADTRADLVVAVRTVLGAWPELAGRSRAVLPEVPVLVSGSPAGLLRLVWLLGRIGLDCVHSDPIELEVGPDLLLVTLPGVTPEPGEQAEPQLPVQDGLSELRRQAARWLARQMEGRLEARVHQGGMTLRVTW